MSKIVDNIEEVNKIVLKEDITDNDEKLSFKADKSNTFTKTEVQTLVTESSPKAKLYFIGGF